MSLLIDSMEDCVLYNVTSVPDGYGGRIDSWVKSDVTFKCAIVFDSSIQAKRAEAEGVKSLYTVTTQRNMLLNYHDVFQRLSDSKFFRVTSNGNEKKTPGTSNLDMCQVTAEEFILNEVYNG